jgi:chitodextrinase
MKAAIFSQCLLSVVLALAAGSVVAQVNVAPAGTAYRWAHNPSASSNANRERAPGLNDALLTTDVNLSGGTGETRAAYQAAGVVWPSPQTITQVRFIGGSWQPTGDGGFCADLKLQTSPDGTTWTDSSWPVSPGYAYDSKNATGVTYSFAGPAATIRGVRVSGRLRCTAQSSYWANVRELLAFDASTGTQAHSLWGGKAVPAIIDSGDAQAVEVGMRFRVTVDGQVTGIRFYKSPANIGPHTGSLWSTNGALLAQGVFSGETASGWQQLSFAAPVTVAANTTYVASYHTSAGRYSANTNFFADAGFANGPLQALSNGADGGNGVYRYGSAPAFPHQTWQATNYWVDLVFVPAAGGRDAIAPTTPAALTATAQQTSRVDLAWAASTDNVGVAKYQVFRNASSTPLVETTVNRHADSAVVSNTSYSYQVRALDVAGNASALSAVATVRTSSLADKTPPSIPTGLRAAAGGPAGISLSWNASTDNVRVVKYQLIRNGVATPIAEPASTAFVDAAVAPGTTYSYQVRALDAANNASGWSTVVTAAAAPLPPGPNPPLGRRGWELTQANVGLLPHGLSCQSLPLYQGSAKPAAGTVIRQVRVTVPLDLSNGNILIEKSCIQPDSVGSHHAYLVTTTICDANGCRATSTGNVVIRDSEIDAEHLPREVIAESCAFLGVGTLERNYLHGMGSGICFFETGAVFNARAVENYVRGLRAWGDPATTGSHNEAATIRDFRAAAGRKAEFLNNRLDCSGGNETGALFIQPTWLPIHNVLIEGNYFEGGGFNLYLERTANAGYGNIHAVNNRFRPTGWGAATTVSGPGYASWQDNHLYDVQRPDAKGAAVSP